MADIFLLELTDDLQPQGEPQRLTFEDRDIDSPVWTPAGDEIVFSSGSWLSERRLLGVQAKRASGAAQYRPVPMTFGENASTLAFSSASHRLVYTREFWNCNLYKVEVKGKTAGTPQKLLLSSGMSYLPDFSPDGQRVAFASTRSGSEEIWVCDADGRSNLRPLTDMGGYLTSCPRWSPDAKRILFHSTRVGSWDLYIVSPDGGQPQRITNHPARENEASWSHDGKWIYFESDRSGSPHHFRDSITLKLSRLQAADKVSAAFIVL
jgi:Tol biopolymer transport system component